MIDKIITIFTPEYQEIYARWRLSNITDYPVIQHNIVHLPPADYHQRGWRKITLEKVRLIIRELNDHDGDSFVYSDPDILFLQPTRLLIEGMMGSNQILFQRDGRGPMRCAGFMAIHRTDAVRHYFSEIENDLRFHPGEFDDQDAINARLPQFKTDYLPDSFSNWAHISNATELWNGHEFDLPESVVMFHANWTVGIANKQNLMDYVWSKK